MLAGINKKATLKMDFYPKAQMEINLTFMYDSNFILFYFISLLEAMKRHSRSNYGKGAKQL